ncbi:hypothetical protein SLA2020_003420 [Shorea laevis]
MDLWVAVAAAAAGYFAKYWQNLPRDKASSLGLSSVDSIYEKPETSSYPFRRSMQGRKLREDVSPDRREVSDGKFSHIFKDDGASAAELGSSRGFDCEKIEGVVNYSNCNVLSLSSLPPELLTNENLGGDDCGNGLGGNVSDDSGKPYTSQIDVVRDSGRNRCPLKTKHTYRHFVKPLSSLESCLMAQLYNNQAKMEEYVLSSLPSPSSPSLRPLLVTDGTKLISRANRDSFSVFDGTVDNKLHLESKLEKSEYLFGVPLLPKIEYLDLKKMKVKREKGGNGRLSSSYKMDKVDNEKHFLKGSHDATVLFCLGISMGLIFSCIAHRREVDKLRELLKRTENLVQDLQEEIAMKDSVTFKELANENYESQERDDNPFYDRTPNPYSSEQNMNNSTTHDEKESCHGKVDHSFESMSKIEAELEAELERLGLNMNAPSFDRRISDHVELDPDFEADFAQGELRVDMINQQAPVESESDQDERCDSTTHSRNYAVSPRELSLRLHEVMQSRLEERVQELETALQNSQRKVKRMESEHQNYWRDFSNTEFRHFSTEESLLVDEDCNSMTQPLVMNLTGEALDAYNEAYDELMKINESEDEDSPSKEYANTHLGGEHLSEGSMSWGQNSAANGSPHPMYNKKEVSSEIFASQVTTSEEHSSRFQELLDVGFSEHESSDCDDEMGRQLIKQIVEKTKKGSPVVLNAQRVLFSMDEHEH